MIGDEWKYAERWPWKSAETAGAASLSQSPRAVFEKASQNEAATSSGASQRFLDGRATQGYRRRRRSN
jgi:hypothetical protein